MRTMTTPARCAPGWSQAARIVIVAQAGSGRGGHRRRPLAAGHRDRGRGRPAGRRVGTEIGSLTVPWYAEAGVELRTGIKVASVEEKRPGADRRRLLGADEVVVGSGCGR